MLCLLFWANRHFLILNWNDLKQIVCPIILLSTKVAEGLKLAVGKEKAGVEGVQWKLCFTIRRLDAVHGHSDYHQKSDNLPKTSCQVPEM